MFCTNCGYKLQSDSNFCTECGFKTKSETETTLTELEKNSDSNFLKKRGLKPYSEEEKEKIKKRLLYESGDIAFNGREAIDGICQTCLRAAPTKYVEFYQNIGMLFARQQKEIKGKLCKNCINSFFWEFTLTNLFLGWWGTISFLVTPFYILNNIFRYITCVSLKKNF